jgi:hypothetical protein
MHYDDTQVDVSRFLMVSVLWAIAGVRIVGGCLATSLVIYLLVSVLNYLARLMVIRVSVCVYCVCLHVSVNVWDREGVHVTVSATVPSPPNRNAIIQAAAIWLILIGVCPFITSIMGCVGTIMYIYTPPAL